MTPQVSIVIINYNTLELTSQCVRSIYDKTKGVSFEVILVDNASTETNPQIFLERFPSIKLVASQENGGFAKGNNLGLSYATGEVVLLLNSDTELVNDAISNCYHELKSDGSVGVVSCKLTYPDGKIQAQASAFPRISTILFDLFRCSKWASPKTKKARYQADFQDYDQSFDCPWLWGAFFMFQRKLLLSFPAGKLHDNFFMYGEDEQWSWYINKALGLRIRYCSEGHVIHYIGGSSTTQLDPFENFMRKMVSNQYWFLSWSRGEWYAKAFYWLKVLYYMSEPRKSSWLKAAAYCRFVKDIHLQRIPSAGCSYRDGIPSPTTI